MLVMLRMLLTDLELATNVVEINIAAGKARQELDLILNSPSRLQETKILIDELLRRSGEFRIELVGKRG